MSDETENTVHTENNMIMSFYNFYPHTSSRLHNFACISFKKNSLRCYIGGFSVFICKTSQCLWTQSMHLPVLHGDDGHMHSQDVLQILELSAQVFHNTAHSFAVQCAHWKRTLSEINFRHMLLKFPHQYYIEWSFRRNVKLAKRNSDVMSDSE